MLYKNKIKVQNILKSAVALMLMLTLSLSTALSPLAKAEEARHTWKTLTSAPISGDLRGIYVSPDGSKLFVVESDAAAHNSSLWMSADDGATWRKIFSKPTVIEHMSISTDGSKMALGPVGSASVYVSVDGGQSWTERHGVATTIMSPDGSFLVGCSDSGATGHTTHISTDDGQTWIQKGTSNISCAEYASNNGTLIARSYDNMARSTDYGQTWTETPNALDMNGVSSFSNNGNNIFDGGNRISLDGGNHWTPTNAPIPAGKEVVKTGISDDGKKLFFIAEQLGATPSIMTLLTSVDGGRTWHSEDLLKSDTVMSNDGSKLFNVYEDNNGRFVYRVGTLPTSQPVTPGSGAGGAVAPSTGSTSATPGQKPGKASGRLAETGTSTWTVGGLAAIAVAAGALALRKRL